MPSENGMAFVVVQHLSPDFKSLMDELLSHQTNMRIHRVEDGMLVEANAVYLIPPKKEMIISDGRLLLTDKDPQQALTLPIDHFFRSLAQESGRDAIAVVLSGTGSDGSRGVRDVHDAGGLVVVQSVESAKFDGMPKSALDTGVADLIMQPEEIPAALLRYIQHPIVASLADDSEPFRPGETGMSKLFRLLRNEYGIDFSHYKPSTVCRRIERRLLMKQIGDVDEYVDRLSVDPDELNSLYKDLLIGVTRFFRDPDAFRRLETEILPELLSQTPVDGEFRIWVPGCGTGEEAYSLAILVRECLDMLNRPVNVKIFATDVHRASTDFASAGVYSQQNLSELEPERIQQYFTQTGDGFQVVQELRQMIVFAHHNIIKDAPFTKLDLISCRNLLIYFQPAAQKKVLSLFHFGLRTGGLLFLGPSESPGELSDEFETIDPHWKFYRKRRDIRLPADMRLPLSTGSVQLHSAALGSPAAARAGWDSQLQETCNVLLDEFMPPALLIDSNRKLLHTFHGSEKYLTLKGGKTSTNIVDLVDSDLRIALSGALNRLEKNQTETRLRGIRIENGTRITLGVKAVPTRQADGAHTLITLEEETPPDSHDDAATSIDINQESRDRVELLENELRYARENLQATVEELETSNEELQAANEELVASNEELQSTNEELHSVNEELYTVNAEYQRKITELTQLNNDMDNLLRSTEVGTVFLDRSLRIRKFTPQISRAFNLLPQDIGRRIDAFTQNIDEPKLLERVAEVLESAKPYEREVRDQQGNWYLLRILPYRSSVLEVEGVVLTLIDISALKQARAEVQELNRQLTGFLENSTTFIYVKDLEGRYTLCNHASESVLGVTPSQVRGRTDYDFLPTEIADRIQAHDREVAANGRPRKFEEATRVNGQERVYLVTKFPLRDERSRIYGVGGVCTDITQRKKAEQRQRLEVVRRDQFLAMLSHELRNPLGAIINALRVLDHKTEGPQHDNSRWVIDRQAHHMSRLLDDLLDVSRVTQGKIELRKEVVDLLSTTKDAIDAVNASVEQRQQKLHVRMPDEPVYVEADPARMQQLQVNLLTNASKYNSDGGNIWLSVEAGDAEVQITVRDDGFGIDSQMRQSIFDLFVQSDTTRSDGGMGVGLTLARAIVEKHGGSIRVESDGIGKGSEFVVCLPLTSKRPAEFKRQVLPMDASETKVLIVEDNSDARETLAELLKLDGYHVITAGDGPAGVEAIKQEHPNAALIDIGLPHLNGYEVARQIRNAPDTDDICLIALTGVKPRSTPACLKDHTMPSLRISVAAICAFFCLVATSAFTLAAQPVPEDVVFEKGIEYANPDNQHLQLNMARPKKGKGPFPAVVCIHGGGFRAGSRERFNRLCIELAGKGYVAVTVTYRLAPKYQFPAAVHDVKAAVRWLRANAKKYNIDPKRIGATGGSAGGHLAQFLGVTAGVKQFEGQGGHPGYSSSVACVVNFYGPSDFTKSYGASVDAAEVLPLFLGGNLQQQRRRHIVASPLYWVTPEAAPTLCIHGTQDRYVAHEQAVWLIDRLKAAEVEGRLMTIEGADHGFRGASKKVREKIEAARIAFFDRHLKKSANQPKRDRKPPIIDRMLPYLILILVVVPIVELVILLQVHHALASYWGGGISLLLTVGTILVTGVVGATLARQQGVGVFRELRRSLGEGKLPGQALVDGVLILIGAALLLTPGFLTDLFGFSLLIPVSRAGYRKMLHRWWQRKIQEGKLKVSTFHRETTVEHDEQIIDTTASPVSENDAPLEDRR
eukprot:g26701.t1